MKILGIDDNEDLLVGLSFYSLSIKRQSPPFMPKFSRETIVERWYDLLEIAFVVKLARLSYDVKGKTKPLQCKIPQRVWSLNLSQKFQNHSQRLS